MPKSNAKSTERASGISNLVLKYQKTKSDADYAPIKDYYDNFKDRWYRQVEDYLDRSTFESEYDYKLHRAVATFNDKKAKDLAAKNEWSNSGRFNRFFFRVLSNWKSNVKNGMFRVRKRQSVQCPVCGRMVARITKEHLEHIRTTSDLPKFVQWNDSIYEAAIKVKAKAACWGEYSLSKLRALQRGEVEEFKSMKRFIKWPWKLENGKNGILCPLTKNIVESVDDEYLMSLPSSINRYYEPYSWERFIEEYPHAPIQSEMFSLEHDRTENNGDVAFKNTVSMNCRLSPSTNMLDYSNIQSGQISLEYLDAFNTITKNVPDTTDQEILRLIAIGYEFDQISETLHLKRAEIKQRIRKIKEGNKQLEECLSR